MNADQEFKKYAKEHLLEPNDEYGSAYTIARYWFMLGWDSRHETSEKAQQAKLNALIAELRGLDWCNLTDAHRIDAILDKYEETP